RMLTAPAALSSFRWMSWRRTIQPSAGASSRPMRSFMQRVPARARSRRAGSRGFMRAYGLPAVCGNAMAGIVVLAWLSVAQAAAQPIRILAFGASITAGYGLDAADSLPVQLEKALRAHGVDATVINGGVSGDTSAGGLARLDWALADNPDLVI